MARLSARYESGHVTAIAGAALVGGTFVKPDSSAGNTQGGEYQVVTCGSGDRPFGVAEVDVTSAQLTQDATSVERRVNVIRRPCIARVVPGGTITAGDALQSDSQGRAIRVASAVAASLATGVVGSNNAITFTANKAGVGGNAITVAITNPGGTVAAEAVTVAGNAITIAARTSTGSITSTAAQIIAALEAHGQASGLVTAVNTSTSTGAGTVAAVGATNLAGGSDPEGSGVLAGVALCNATNADPFVEVDLR